MTRGAAPRTALTGRYPSHCINGALPRTPQGPFLKEGALTTKNFTQKGKKGERTDVMPC